MGIIMATFIGAAVLAVTGGGIFVYKEGERSLEKVRRLIKEVDNKPEPAKKPEDKIKEILDKVNEDEVEARWILKKVADVTPGTKAEKSVHEITKDVDQAIADMDIEESEHVEETAIDYNQLTVPEMNEEFQNRYAEGPVYQSAAAVFGKALNEGLITKDTYDKAYGYYGDKLWFYVGD